MGLWIDERLEFDLQGSLWPFWLMSCRTFASTPNLGVTHIFWRHVMKILLATRRMQGTEGDRTQRMHCQTFVNMDFRDFLLSWSAISVPFFGHYVTGLWRSVTEPRSWRVGSPTPLLYRRSLLVRSISFIDCYRSVSWFIYFCQFFSHLMYFISSKVLYILFSLLHRALLSSHSIITLTTAHI